MIGTGFLTMSRRPIRCRHLSSNWNTLCSSSHSQTLSIWHFSTVTPIVVLAVASLLKPLQKIDWLTDWLIDWLYRIVSFNQSKHDSDANSGGRVVHGLDLAILFMHQERRKTSYNSSWTIAKNCSKNAKRAHSHYNTPYLF